MASKDTVYIDIDEDITSVINKVEASGDKVVALVLPKRATVFQSTINMKLLKKSAAAAHKSLVLITSDTSILPLAGAARLHVAKSLQSKPVIPAAPHAVSDAGLITSDEFNAEGSTLVSSEGSAAAAKVVEEVIELDNTDKTDKVKKTGPAADVAPKNRKLRVPNFNRFRVKVFLGIFLFFALIIGWVFGFIIMPKAKIIIRTDATSSPVSLQFTASTDVKTLDNEKALLPAKIAESKKTDSEKVPATGKKDEGTKATGTVDLKNCSSSDNDITVPAGTTVSTGGFNFITQADIELPASIFSGGNKCLTSSKDVDVTAQNAGGSYNLSEGRTYAVSGFSEVTGIGSAMGGGTSKIVDVVSQEDISGAQAKLTGRQKSSAVGELQSQLNVDGSIALEETLDEGTPAFTSNVAVGQPASEVTVSAVTTYKMLGITKDDLKSVVETSIKKSITDSKKKILKNGIDDKVLLVIAKRSPNDQTLSLSTSAIVGPDIDIASIAKESAGKKRGDIIATLGLREGVKDVTVTYSPFWVLQTPKKASKITVIIDQTDAK